ncbi:hypothetical protein ACFFIY_09275 [Bhargavaea ullalensis]|uniref:Uncharacterized protein n=1 Tax=Bhargavaea ullalensis TaxID=1265685 RepID=A0ABV2GES8_9BACL
MDKDSGFFDKAKDTLGKVAGKAMDKVNEWADEVESQKEDGGHETQNPGQNTAQRSGQTGNQSGSGEEARADGRPGAQAGEGRPRAAGEFEYNERGTRGENRMAEFGGIPTADTGTDKRADAKPSSDLFGVTPDTRKPVPPNQFAGQAELEGVSSGKSRSARYEEQEPVEDFTDETDSAISRTRETGDVPQGNSTNVAYGDPVGRYDGHEEDLLSDEERQSRYEEQGPVRDFLDEDPQDPPQPFGDAGHRPY